jgi:hypothetical protein
VVRLRLLLAVFGLLHAYIDPRILPDLPFIGAQLD